ncbi:MAG: PTS sugar transporter subunit IIA [bacterium]|jgi:mannitol/fructose-specific phosphotransferase system IIA component (Ntr-type)
MNLSKLVLPKKINLNLEATTKEAVIEELVEMLRLSGPASKTLVATLLTREYLGSTGVGNGIAIPHCRSLVVSRVRVAIGRSRKGIPYKSIDKKRAKIFFLIVAPPVGDPSDYLIVLGQVAQVAKKLAKDKRLPKIKTGQELIDLIKEFEK